MATFRRNHVPLAALRDRKRVSEVRSICKRACQLDVPGEVNHQSRVTIANGAADPIALAWKDQSVNAHKIQCGIDRWLESAFTGKVSHPISIADGAENLCGIGIQPQPKCQIPFGRAQNLKLSFPVRIEPAGKGIARSIHQHFSREDAVSGQLQTHASRTLLLNAIGAEEQSIIGSFAS